MGSTQSRLSIAEVEEIQKECPQCKKKKRNNSKYEIIYIYYNELIWI